ncbi:hypothetical protein BIW11_14366, partial [Tropilaelaps mercedesae]
VTSKPEGERSSYRSSSATDYPSRTSTALATRRQSYGARQSSRVQDSESDSESEESETQPQTSSLGRRLDESSTVSVLLSRSQEARRSMADNAAARDQQRHRNRKQSHDNVSFSLPMRKRPPRTTTTYPWLDSFQ